MSAPRSLSRLPLEIVGGLRLARTAALFSAAGATLLATLFGTLHAPAAHAELGYLQYSAGVSIAPYQNIVGEGATGIGLNGRLENDPGYTIGVAVGTNAWKRDALNLRGEIAVDYRSADVSGMSLSNDASKTNGELNLFTAMINGYVDYDLGIYVVPYLGAGVGYGRLEVNAENRFRALKIDDTASVFAWNVMGGVTIPMTSVVDLTLGYRYVATTDPEYNARLLALPTPSGPRSGSQRLDSEYDAHEAALGLKIKF